MNREFERNYWIKRLMGTIRKSKLNKEILEIFLGKRHHSLMGCADLYSLESKEDRVKCCVKLLNNWKEGYGWGPITAIEHFPEEFKEAASKIDKKCDARSSWFWCYIRK